MYTRRFMQGLAAAAGAMAVAMALFVGVGSAHGAEVQVTPSQAGPGATITITGTGFEAGKEVTITLEGALAQTKLGTAIADQNESFTFEATVPASTAAGSFMVRAMNAAAGGDDDTTGDLIVTAAPVAQSDQMQPRANTQANAETNMQGNSQSTGQAAAQPGAAQPTIVHERTTAEDVIVGVIFGGLAVIGLILIRASRVHGTRGSYAG